MSKYKDEVRRRMDALKNRNVMDCRWCGAALPADSPETCPRCGSPAPFRRVPEPAR